MKILVADDDVVSRLILENVLSEMGDQRVSVESGDDFLSSDGAPRIPPRGFGPRPRRRPHQRY